MHCHLGGTVYVAKPDCKRAQTLVKRKCRESRLPKWLGIPLLGVYVLIVIGWPVAVAAFWPNLSILQGLLATLIPDMIVAAAWLFLVVPFVRRFYGLRRDRDFLLAVAAGEILAVPWSIHVVWHVMHDKDHMGMRCEPPCVCLEVHYEAFQNLQSFWCHWERDFEDGRLDEARTKELQARLMAIGP